MLSPQLVLLELLLSTSLVCCSRLLLPQLPELLLSIANTTATAAAAAVFAGEVLLPQLALAAVLLTHHEAMMAR
jgi:hypothetical protein